MKKTFILIVIIFLASTIQNASAQSGCLRAYYPLNGSAADISGNNNHGVLHGPTFATDRFGNPGSAALFNGSSAYIELPSDFDYPQKTICAWVSVANYSANMGLVYSSDHAAMVYGGTGVNTMYYSGTNEIAVGVGSKSVIQTGTLTNTWYHLALSAGATWLKFYINGNIVDSVLNNSVTHSADGNAFAHLGCNRLLTRFFNGSIDDVMIFDCALEEHTIDSIYGISTIDTTCLVAWYPLNGNAQDISGNALHGTAYGTTAALNRYGTPGQALHFNGTSDYIELPSDFDFPQKTICAWISVENYSANMGLVYSSDHAAMVYGGTGVNTMYYSGSNEIAVGVGSNSLVKTNTETNAWVHVALSAGDTWLKFYINGNIVDSVLNNSVTHSTDGIAFAHLGCNRLITRFFSGVIDEVKIYDCALTGDEIAEASLGSEEIHSDMAQFIIYPNPGSEKVYIESPVCSGNSVLSVFDLQGRMMIRQPFSGNHTALDVTSFPHGIYMIQLTGEYGVITKKFIRE